MRPFAWFYIGYFDDETGVIRWCIGNRAAFAQDIADGVA